MIKKATRTVTFRYGDEDFKVKFDLILNEKNMIIPQLMEFFNFLKKLSVLSESEEATNWFASCDGVCLDIPSSYNQYSLMIRRKAHRLGFVIIPGKKFIENKQKAYRNAARVSYNIHHNTSSVS